VSHNFIHLPFFRSRIANAAFSAYLSAVLGLPQTIWRDRHLAHHADRAWRFRPSPQLALDTAAAAAMWAFMASHGSGFFLSTWVIGWVIGLTLCQLQGHYEHARGTVSHYGALYNRLFFNDGFHVEHHARPGMHWTALPEHAAEAAPASRWPAVLRWLEWRPLDALERLVLASPTLQRFVVSRHEQAFARVLGPDARIRRATIVGGGLFPRTAIVLRRLFPDAELTVVDRSADHLAQARRFLDARVLLVNAVYSAGHGAHADLVVIPLAFLGDREQVYGQPAAPLVAVHDWIWRRRGAASAIVSVLLAKRLNLVRR
jgi:hypothetical protein